MGQGRGGTKASTASLSSQVEELVCYLGGHLSSLTLLQCINLDLASHGQFVPSIFPRYFLLEPVVSNQIMVIFKWFCFYLEDLILHALALQEKYLHK